MVSKSWGMPKPYTKVSGRARIFQQLLLYERPHWSARSPRDTTVRRCRGRWKCGAEEAASVPPPPSLWSVALLRRRLSAIYVRTYRWSCGAHWSHSPERITPKASRMGTVEQTGLSREWRVQRAGLHPQQAEWLPIVGKKHPIQQRWVSVSRGDLWRL